MRKALGLMIGGVLGLAFIFFAPNAQANIGNQLIEFTFNQAIQLPGDVVLPANSYWFLMPEYGHGDAAQVMQIYNEDRSKVLATIGTFDTSPLPRHDNGLAIPITANAELTFVNLGRNKPLMLVSWFYPADNVGHELVYPARQERQLSEGRPVTVMVNTRG